MPDRLPAPWTVVPQAESYEVQDANGFTITWVHFRVRGVIGTNPDRLTKDQARRVAAHIARIPEYARKGLAEK